FIYWLTTLPPGMWESQAAAGLLAGMLALAFHSSMSAAYTLWPLKFGDGRPNDMGMILAAAFAPQPPPRESALIWAEALFAHGVEPQAWDEWIAAHVRAAALAPKPGPRASALGFALALAEGDVQRAQMIAEAGDHDVAHVLRGYLLAEAGQATRADDALAAVIDRANIAAAAPWRMLAIARIQALTGAGASAQRAMDDFAEELAESPTPQPFWEEAPARTRHAISAPASTARP
ncbi:MAG TPA: hypothetical protein PLS69_09075, partial [Terricaulis sp.]|nr:hypothetical protein [Terricaulis sp.]